MDWSNLIGAAGSLLGGDKEEKEEKPKVAPKTKISKLTGVISDITDTYRNDAIGNNEASQAGDALAGAMDNVGKLATAIKEKRQAGK